MRAATAALVAWAIALAPMRVPAAAPSHAEAMLALCRLWNAVRFSSPDLTDEADERWDDALLAVAPKVDADPSALRAAASAMLATLRDPMTIPADDDGPGAAGVAPRFELRDGIRIVTAGMPRANEAAEAYAAELAPLVQPTAADRAVIVDLRGGGMPSFDQRGTIAAAWDNLALASHVIASTIPVPRTEHRYLMGFPPEAEGADYAGYSDGRESEGTPQWVAPAKGAHEVAVAYLADASSQLPADAVALAQAGRAAIFAAQPDAVSGPGQSILFAAGSGLEAALRTSALAGDIPVRGGGIDAALAWLRAGTPFALPALRQRPSTPVATRYASPALPDEAHRVLAAFRVWGTIAYAFPYRDQMSDNWDAALAIALEELRAVRTPLEYELALRKLYAHIHDSHGDVYGPASSVAFAATPAFRVADVEKRITIVDANPVVARFEGFRVGDTIEEIDGVTPAAARAKWLPYVAASTPQSANLKLEFPGGPGLFSGPVGTTLVLTLRGADGVKRTVTARRRPIDPVLFRRTRPTIDVLAGNVGYLDLTRLTVAETEPALQRLASTRVLVLDLRGYPRGTFWVLAPHFASKIVRATLYRTPVRRVPVAAPDAASNGITFVDETRDFYQTIVPKAPRYSRPVVVVVDARAISQSEHTALYLRAAAGARFVGEPTAGADGDVTSFRVPGGMTFWFSGQAVLHPDGTPLQRVGVIPDVSVAPTLAGIRAGDDELLSAALREALSESHAPRAMIAAALATERSAERGDARARRQPPPPPGVASADAPALEGTFAVGGGDPTHYTGGGDATVRHRDGRTVALRAETGADPGSYATYRVTLNAAPYRGKHVRVSGWLRARDVQSADAFVSVLGSNAVLSKSATLVGDAEWTACAAVIDVPESATSLLAGIRLTGGRGVLWADDLKIDVVQP
jgi:C-terminal processing protease CtpA/Prc